MKKLTRMIKLITIKKVGSKKPSQQQLKPQTNQTYPTNELKSPMYHSPIM
ncbi:hypothetical protein ACO2E6_02130 [Staphylococcus aureus]